MPLTAFLNMTDITIVVAREAKKNIGGLWAPRDDAKSECGILCNIYISKP